MKVKCIKSTKKLIFVILSLILGFVFSATPALTKVFADSGDYTVNNDDVNYMLAVEPLRPELSSRYIVTSDIVPNSGYVYTYNGSAVPVLHRTELSEDKIAEYNAEIDSSYPNATRLADSTRRYNCHSYAWYKQSSTDNEYWMNDPSLYYTDGSYQETTTPKVGDKVCYFTSNGFNEHSAVIVSIDSNGNITVRSKWGSCGLYEHALEYCPYMLQYGGAASYVKYYTHIHNYNKFCVNYNELKHKSFCGCGAHSLSSHYIRLSSDTPLGRYVKCAGCGAMLDTYTYRYPGVMTILPPTDII